MSSLLVFQLPLSDWRLSKQQDTLLNWSEHLFHFVYSQDGHQISNVGQCLLQDIPIATRVVGVVGLHDVAWHRVMLPKAPLSRLKTILFGLLEEQILGDPHQTHFARSRFATMGRHGWIAAVHQEYLKNCIQALRSVDRHLNAIISISEPEDDFGVNLKPDPELVETNQQPVTIHVQKGVFSEIEVVASSQDGIVCLPPNAPMVEHWISDPSTQWTVESDLGTSVSEWLKRDFITLDKNERLFQAAIRGTNLLQFELTPSTHNKRRLHEYVAYFSGRRWRPVYVGLAAIVLTHILGLQLYAWQLNQQIQLKRDQIQTLIQATFPSIQVILDAPKQIQKELDVLKNRSGQPGSQDFESLLNKVADAWPPGKQQARNIRYESGKLHLTVDDWQPYEWDQFKNSAAFMGWDITMENSEIVLKRH